ncbi:MAG: ATP-binding protein [Natronosporangium sp.]
MKYFNTAGPCNPERHYMLPPEPRLPDARALIDEGQYFVVHAPRQTGKTTTLSAIARTLTAEGRYLALHFSCETAEPAGDDYLAAQRAVLGAIGEAARIERLPDELQPPRPWPDADPEQRLFTGLSAWAANSPRLLVLFFDEIDALRGESLRSVLRQLRDGSRSRPDAFPASVVLCGLRDVRDYKAASGGDPTRLGTSSPFNIKVASLRIGDFTPAEVRELYAQHTAETGQPFTDEAVDLAFTYTQGQPWLVNALAREITREMAVPAPAPITAEHVDQAKERLILARATHLDSLVARLQEPRVRRVVAPLISGELATTDETYDDDVAYLRDLGLLAPTRPLAIANPIYREVIVRVMGARTEDVVVDDPRSFVLPDGRLDFGKLLREFAAFWRQHGEVLVRGAFYHEAAPQLVIMAYFHRIVNGGGYIDREYGVGRGRIDLLVRWPYTGGNGKRAWQREAVELKVWRPARPDPLEEGLRQLDDYLDRLDLDRGTLVVFDWRDEAAPHAERTRFEDAATPSGRPVTLLRA